MTDDIKKGTVKPVSFPAGTDGLIDYVETLASEKFGYNFSAAILDCIKAHQMASTKFGDWRQMEVPPGWAKEIMEKK